MSKPVKKLLRIYTDEAATVGDRKVFEHIVSLARRRHLAGVTVLAALLGFGRSSHLHRPDVLASDRSVVIEIIDDEDALRAFASELHAELSVGLMTLEPVEVLTDGT